jgi:hypothetical protein
MKKFNLMFTAAIALAGFTACKSSSTEAAKQDAADLTHYVDSVQKLAPVYTVSNWSSIDNGYQERALKAEKTLTTLSAEDKEALEKSKARYNTLKASYEAKLKENETVARLAGSAVATSAIPDFRQVLRNKLFGEGKIGADMKFAFVTGANILSVYKNFVNTVADNKNNYSREDWDEIKVLYEALDTRKNAVEKDLAGSDNIKIAGLKIKFASIKATHRGGTKGAENEAAKQ